MKFFTHLATLALFIAHSPTFLGQGAPSKPGSGNQVTSLVAAPADGRILPQQFAGWQMSGLRKASNDPAAADPVNASLLKEYGFTDFESATYTREDGRKLEVKAARFADASGSYGAFTFYRLPQMLVERFGDEGASLNERELFFRYNVLIDAVFDKRTAMTAAQLRDLSDAIPRPPGNAGNPPSLAGRLPANLKVINSEKYVGGAVGWEKIGSPLPPELVNFNVSPEIAISDYQTATGRAKLILIAYPTPQIAAEQMQKIQTAQKQSSQLNGLPTASEIPAVSGRVFQKRSGPILALTLGAVSESDARGLLAPVNYDADVTWNENTHFTKKDNVANLLVNVIVLCGILGAMAIVAGLAFGGMRVLLQRLYPERMMASEAKREFISLHLAQAAPESAVKAPDSR